MKRATWRRLRSPAALALAACGGLPTVADAQLFPNAPIKRERVPCPAESPIFNLYRHEYFGYHPTCWRRFPAGWGCPSPEAPNAQAEFQRRPLDNPLAGSTGPLPEEPLDDLPPDEMSPTPPPVEGNLPPVPEDDRSPFSLDPPTPTPRRPGTEPTPPPSASPVDPLAPPRRAVPPAAAVMPGLDAGRPAPSSLSASDGDGPTLELPELPDSSSPFAPGGMLAPGVSPPMGPGPIGEPIAKAPQRRGVLSGLFGGNRRRR